jgi:hypothetical protein
VRLHRKKRTSVDKAESILERDVVIAVFLDAMYAGWH